MADNTQFRREQSQRKEFKEIIRLKFHCSVFFVFTENSPVQHSLVVEVCIFLKFISLCLNWHHLSSSSLYSSSHSIKKTDIHLYTNQKGIHCLCQLLYGCFPRCFRACMQPAASNKPTTPIPINVAFPTFR